MNNMEMPKAIYSEEVILGTILHNPEKFSYIGDKIRSEYFYTTLHQNLFKEIQKLCKMGEPLSLKMVMEKLHQQKKLSDYTVTRLSNLVSTAIVAVEGIETNIDRVIEAYKKRKIIEVSKRVVMDCYGQEKTVDDIISFWSKAIYNLKESKGNMLGIEEVLWDALQGIEERFRNKGKLIGATTGFKAVDEAIYGLKKKEFMVLAARPSMGKTALALNMINSAAVENKVAVFSLEMSHEELGDRMLSEAGNIPLSKIKKGEINEKGFEKLLTASSILNKNNITIYDGPALTVSQIRAKAMQLKIDKGLDLLVIDYLQLIEGEGNYIGNRVYEMCSITRGLKCIAKDLDINVLALAQLSRAPDSRADRRPVPSDLKDSGSIEQDADVIMFLYRDEYYNKDEDNKGMAELSISKNRNGRTGVIKMLWQPEYQRFTSNSQKN